MTHAIETSTRHPDHIPAELAERAEALAHELSSHAGVLPVVFGRFAMELASEWFERVTPLAGDGAPIVLLPRMHRWLVTKLGESDAIFVFSGRENAIVRARALAVEQGVAFFAIGPAGAVTDRMPASRSWDVAEFDAAAVDGPIEMPDEKSDPPTLEIRIEKKGRKYLVLIGEVVVATASNKQRALKKADLLRQDPDVMSLAHADGMKAA